MAPPPPNPIADIERVGVTRQRDLYHFLIRSSWRRLILLFAALYVATNALFAFAYLALGGIENARPGSFADAFFFSVQTMATIGYGKMAPVTAPAHILVTIQAVLGTLEIAVATGITFAKFSQATARILWSRNMIIHRRDGVPCLVFRLGNERTSNVVEAQLRLTALISDKTKEGEGVRRMVDLRLQRDRSALFAMSWLAVHPIDESSPLFGLSPEDYAAKDILFVPSLVGTEETFGQTIHSRTYYTWKDVLAGHRFVDVITVSDTGRRQIDYSKFHDTTPLGDAEPPHWHEQKQQQESKAKASAAAT